MLTILLYIRVYNHNPYASQVDRKWYIFLILWQLPIVVGVIMMFLMKRIGLWIYLISKIVLFGLPLLAGIDVFGLAFPILLIESATFFILFGKRIQYMD